MDDRSGAAARSDPRHRERAMGPRGCSRRVRPRAGPVGDHLHCLRPRRSRGLPRNDNGFQDGRASRGDQATGRQERGAVAAQDRRRVDPLPPPEDGIHGVPRRHSRFALPRPPHLGRPRGGHAATLRRVVGLTPNRNRAAAVANRAWVAPDLPRRQRGRRRDHLQGRSCIARPGRADARPPPASSLDPLAARSL